MKAVPQLILVVILALAFQQALCQKKKGICTKQQLYPTFAPCDKPCTKIYKKTCGVVMGVLCFREYGNDCEFEIAVCKNPNIKKISCDGPQSVVPRLLSVLNPLLE